MSSSDDLRVFNRFYRNEFYRNCNLCQTFPNKENVIDRPHHLRDLFVLMNKTNKRVIHASTANNCYFYSLINSISYKMVFMWHLMRILYYGFYYVVQKAEVKLPNLDLVHIRHFFETIVLDELVHINSQYIYIYIYLFS